MAITYRRAKLQDIDQIMDIMQSNLISTKINNGASKKEIQRGFLYYPLTKQECISLIRLPENTIIFGVCTNKNEVLSYGLAYDFDFYCNIHKEYLEIKESEECLKNKKVIYLRHVANKENSDGKEIGKYIISEAIRYNYDVIIGEILHSDKLGFSNIGSKLVHTRIYGFKKFTTIRKNDKSIWDIYFLNI